MTTATSKARVAPARPAPAKCCGRCGSAILGLVQICELARLTPYGPELDRWVLCGGCCDAIRCYLGARPDRVPASPPAPISAPP